MARPIIICILFSVLFSAYVWADLTTNIIAVWNFNENQTTQYDTENGYALDNSGATFLAGEFINNSFDFLISNNAFFNGTYDAFKLNSSFTMKLWVNPDSNNQFIIGNDQLDGGNYGGFNIQILPSGGVGAVLWQGVGASGCFAISPNETLPLGNWSMIAMVFDDANDTLTTYINGHPVEIVTFCFINPPYFVPQSPLYVGGFFGAGSFDGSIDELAFWNRPLSSEELAALYGNESMGISYPYGISNCTPDWICSGYGVCNISDLAPCGIVTDNNACGDTYGGDYSEFSPQPCNYCQRDIAILNATDCASHQSLHCYLDNNWATCCNLTGLSSDCFGDVVQPSDTVCVYESCSMFAYSENDITGAVIDTTAKVFITVSSLAGIVVFGIAGLWVYNSLGMRKFR